MRIDFNVLWIDDQPARIEAQIKAITTDMEAEGFSFNPTLCLSMDEVRPKIADGVFSDEIDLILVDWDLGAGVKGDQVIAEIRETVPYKDVVFYSAHTPPDQLRQLAYDAKVEGVYCAERASLRDEVVGVFESLVKKVLDLDHTRGIVLGATSDIDQMVLECLRSIHATLGDVEKENILRESLERIEVRVRESAALLAKVKGEASLGALIEAHEIFTANDRLRVLSRVLKLEALKEHKGARDSVILYMTKVVPQRNVLGHQVLSPEGRPVAIAGEGGRAITVGEMRDLRRLILQLRAEFRGLLRGLTPSVVQ